MQLTPDRIERGRIAPMTDIDSISDAPWSRYEWSGKFVTADGAPTDDFTREDVEEILAFGTTGDYWDGETAGVARLKDGRIIAWESSYGPIGSGFCHDAYGGDANIIVARTVNAALKYISEKARELLGDVTPVTTDRLTELERLYALSKQPGPWTSEHWSALFECRDAVPELIASLRRLVTITDEAFGPFPVETIEGTMSRLERGVFEQRQRIADLEAQIAQNAAGIDVTEEHLRARIATLEDALSQGVDLADDGLDWRAERWRDRVSKLLDQPATTKGPT